MVLCDTIFVHTPLFFPYGVFDAISISIYLNPDSISDAGSLFSSVELQEIKTLCIFSDTKMTATNDSLFFVIQSVLHSWVEDKLI